MNAILSVFFATLPMTNPIATPPSIHPSDVLPEEETQEIVFLDEEDEVDALFSDLQVEE